MELKHTPLRFALALAILSGSHAARGAPEYIEQELPAAGNVNQSVESLEHAFQEPPPSRISETVRDTIREGELKLHLRNYYFDRYRENDRDSEAWAQGGWLAYQTAGWKDRLRLGATLHTSQKLYGPDDKDGTLLLKPGQEGFTVLGEAWLEAQLKEKTNLRLYRQSLDLPYINRDDIRMIPNTFEAITLTDNSHPSLTWAIGQVERIKQKNSSSFESMTEAAGIDRHHDGVSFAGIRYSFANGSNLGAINEYTPDFMNIFYAEANSRMHTRGDWGFQLSAQYTDQSATGDKHGGDFDTHSWGFKSAVSHFGVVATLAYTSTANNAGIRSPWGGRPSYLSIIIKDFDRAGEDAWLIGLSSDFRNLGLDGLSAFINYAWGDTPENGSIASPDQSELDLTLDYRFRQGVMEGFWIRARSAFVDQDGDDGEDIRDLRIILNYDIALF